MISAPSAAILLLPGKANYYHSLHSETRPSFYVNVRKNLFCYHGCGHGGDLIRFVELSQHLSFRQTLTYLGQQQTSADPAAVLGQACAFYQRQLDRYPEALRYLEQRGLLDPTLIRAHPKNVDTH